jgi:RNase P subunit RPR2
VQICREDGEILIPNQAIHSVETLFAEEISRDDIVHQNILKLRDDEKNSDGSVTQKYRDRNQNQTTWEKLQINCNECNVSFPAYQLSIHQLSDHQNSKTRNFTCLSCPEQKIFFNLESFVNHTFTIHYEYLRYFCFICDKIFWNYKALYFHLKALHSSYKAHVCLFCGKLHKSGYDLKMHKELHSKLAKDDEDGITFNCSFCPKTYKRKLQLQRHIETHKNDKHWICETCGVS